MKSSVVTARIATTCSEVRESPITPTDFTGSNTANACAVSPRNMSADSSSDCTILSERRRRSSRSLVTSPRQRIASPGPGNGCRHTKSWGYPSCSPTERTSSLNMKRRGSIRVKGNSLGSPPTLWWVLIFSACSRPLPLLSTTSGYMVP